MRPKHSLAATALAGAVALTPAAEAKAPTHQHVREYLAAYAKARRLFGRRAPGCKLIGQKASCHLKASDAQITRSLRVLARMLAPPPPAPVAPPHGAVLSPPPAGVSLPPAGAGGGSSTTVTASPGSGVVQCIIQRESGGNPQATNGQYGGIGQWSPTAWQQDGGTKYAASPTGASYSQQLAVLNAEGSSPQGFGQQTNFDGC